MSDTIVIELAGEPVAWARTRLRLAQGRAIPFKPNKQRNHAAALQYAASAAMQGQAPLDGPVSLSVVATLPIPQSWSQKKQAEARAGQLYPAKKPDWDNLGKQVSDSLNGICYADDAQICFATVSKVYGEKPGLRIEVQRLAQELSEAA